MGSVSTRLEPISRWIDIREGRAVDNFNPASLTSDCKMDLLFGPVLYNYNFMFTAIFSVQNVLHNDIGSHCSVSAFGIWR